MNDRPAVRWIDARLLDELGANAAASPRRRRNLNFHADDAAAAHRLLNAIARDSYVPPHRHLDVDKDESIVIIRGSIGVVVFAADGSVADTAVLAVGGPCIGVDLPHGVYHSLVALSDDCIVFEAKAGPYLPLRADEKAPWAPAEGDAEAAAYHDQLRRLFAAPAPGVPA